MMQNGRFRAIPVNKQRTEWQVIDAVRSVGHSRGHYVTVSAVLPEADAKAAARQMNDAAQMTGHPGEPPGTLRR